MPKSSSTQTIRVAACIGDSANAIFIKLHALFPNLRFVIDFENPDLLLVEQSTADQDIAIIDKYPSAAVLYFSGECSALVRYIHRLYFVYMLLFKIPLYPFKFLSSNPQAFVMKYFPWKIKVLRWAFYQLVLRRHKVSNWIRSSRGGPYASIAVKASQMHDRVCGLLSETVASFGRPRILNYPHGFIGTTHYDYLEEPMPTGYEQRKFCAVITSNMSKLELFQLYYLINQYRRVDFFGKGLYSTEGPYPKFWGDSHMCMAGYKFALVTENTIHPGYITEKLPMAFRSGAVPIYHGAPEIGDYFNTDRMICVADYPSIQAVIQEIRRLNEDDAAYQALLALPILTAANKANYAKLQAKFKQTFCEILPSILSN